MQESARRLSASCRGRSPRLGLVSMYDVENNAVRILAATLREAGHHVTEIYFKDWVSNHLLPASDRELDAVVGIVRERRLDLLCISIRASAYHEAARVLTRHVRRATGIPVLWGGMHPTLVPRVCASEADLLLRGEGEEAILELVESLRDGAALDHLRNLAFLDAGGELRINPLRPLVADLDSLPFRDYTSHDDKFFVHRGRVRRGDPMHGDPVYQMMGSRGCVYRCSYCYNSTYKKEIYPGQKWFRVRSPASMIEEIRRARAHWDMKRIRFDDEVFNFQEDWLRDFCERYPREVGLPFEIFIEPKLVEEGRMRMLRDAGLVGVYMGVQSSERVTGELYDRKVKNRTVARIARLYHELGIKPHFQLIFDDPVATEDDRRALFELVASFPHPFDLYLFSMTVFPGSELNHRLIESGVISPFDIEGVNTRVFYQHRVNLAYPRPVEDTFWIALIQMLSKGFIPRSAVRALSHSRFLRRHPWPLIQAANAANYVKMGGTVARMVAGGELTPTLWRRWASTSRIITT